MKKENLFLSTFYNFVGLFIKKFFGFLFNVFIARILDKEKFGIFSFILSITNNVSIISNIGLSATQKYLITKYEKEKDIISTLFFIKLLLILFASLIVLLFSIIFLPKYLNLVILGIIYFSLFSIIYFFIDVFTSKKQFKKANFYEIVFIFLRNILSLFFAYIGYSVFGVFIGLIFGAIPIFIYLIYKLKPKINEFNKKYLKEIFNFSFYSGVSDLSWVIYGNTDSIILGILLNPVFVGFYSISSRFISVVSNTLNILISTSFPYFISWIKKGNFEKVKKTYDLYIKYSFFFIIPVFLIFFIKSEPIIRLVYGNQYHEASIVLSILSFLIILTPLVSLYQNILYSLNRLKEIAFISTTTAILNIFLDIFFVYLFGFIGVAISTVILFTIITLYYYFLLKKEYGLIIPRKTIILNLISFIIFAILLIIFRPLIFPIDIIIPSLVYVIYVHLFILDLNKLFKKYKNKIFE